MIEPSVSKMIGAHMRKFCHVAREHVRVVHNGVDTEAFRPLADAKERADLRRRLGVADEIVFLDVSASKEDRGTLLDVVRRTAERLEAMGLPEGVDLHPLFGDLSRAAQDQAIAPSPAGRGARRCSRYGLPRYA